MAARSARRTLIVLLALTLLAVVLVTATGTWPAEARHTEFDAETLLVPWQHDGQTFKAVVGQPFEVGARWGACTPELAALITTWPDLTGPTLEVSDGSASWPTVEWGDPINPTTRVQTFNFSRCSEPRVDGRTGWWVYWRAPITFNSPGIYEVTLSMSTQTPLSDGIGVGIVDLTGTITVEVPPDLALFKQNKAEWKIRYRDGSTVRFFYGDPGGFPLMGDWDCDGTDTVAVYRTRSGRVSYRNQNNSGVPDGEFFFGSRGDRPIAGDWNNDGCDTFGVYRNGKVFLRNTLDTGTADIEYFFGLEGDRPFAGDFDGVGGSTVGVYRRTEGVAYLRNSLTTGEADLEFSYANFRSSQFDEYEAQIVPGDWDWDGDDTVGAYSPRARTFYLSLDNIDPADITISFGQPAWVPTSGVMVPQDPGDIVDCADFTAQAEAQAWHDYYVHWYGDIANLDGDGDGEACESL